MLKLPGRDEECPKDCHRTGINPEVENRIEINGISPLMNCRQHMSPQSISLPVLLRLRQANRYVVVVRKDERTISSKPFWNELQALLAMGIPNEFWPYVRTEVLSMIHHNDLPPGTVLFARKNRRGDVLSVVSWLAEGIDTKIYTSIEQALIAVNAKNPSKKPYAQTLADDIIR